MLKGPIEVAIPSMRMPLPTLDQIRLERFVVALESLEPRLTIRTTLISKEDRFALLEPIIETHYVANSFKTIKSAAQSQKAWLQVLQPNSSPPSVRK